VLAYEAAVSCVAVGVRALGRPVPAAPGRQDRRS